MSPDQTHGVDDIGDANASTRHHTLVLCTKNRPDAVSACLRHVIHAENAPTRIVVVDASDAHRTRDVIARIDGSVKSEIVHVPSAPGLTRQRNCGVSLVRSEIVHFLDDDAFVRHDYFTKILELFDSADDAVGVGGVQSGVGKIRQSRLRSFFFLMARPGRVSKAAVNIEADESLDRVGPVDWLSGCCMSFRTDVARVVKFDERLAGYGLGEDLDFSLRISRFGKLLIQPAAIVDHPGLVASGRPRYRELARDDVVHRWYFVGKAPERFSKWAFVWSVVGLLSLRTAQFIRRHPGAGPRLAGVADGVRTLAMHRSWD